MYRFMGSCVWCFTYVYLVVIEIKLNAMSSTQPGFMFITPLMQPFIVILYNIYKKFNYSKDKQWII